MDRLLSSALLAVLVVSPFAFCPDVARAAPAASAGIRDLLGRWEGESICQVPGSPCHDEHVVYQFTPLGRAADSLRLDGFKVVRGEEQFMGTLRCSYDVASRTLICTFRGRDVDEWRYTLAGDSLSGTLRTDRGRTLYRIVRVKRRGPRPRPGS